MTFVVLNLFISVILVAFSEEQKYDQVNSLFSFILLINGIIHECAFVSGCFLLGQYYFIYYLFLYLFIYFVYVCVCLCVCMCTTTCLQFL